MMVLLMVGVVDIAIGCTSGIIRQQSCRFMRFHHGMLYDRAHTPLMIHQGCCIANRDSSSFLSTDM